MALFGNGTKTVTVEKCEGGWILSWSDPSRSDDYDSINYWPKPKRPETSGREIFTDVKKLLRRVGELV